MDHLNAPTTRGAGGKETEDRSGHDCAPRVDAYERSCESRATADYRRPIRRPIAISLARRAPRDWRTEWDEWHSLDENDLWMLVDSPNEIYTRRRVLPRNCVFDSRRPYPDMFYVRIVREKDS